MCLLTFRHHSCEGHEPEVDLEFLRLAEEEFGLAAVKVEGYDDCDDDGDDDDDDSDDDDSDSEGPTFVYLLRLRERERNAV